jgi:hypothetical protein
MGKAMLNDCVAVSRKGVVGDHCDVLERDFWLGMTFGLSVTGEQAID